MREGGKEEGIESAIQIIKIFTQNQNCLCVCVCVCVCVYVCVCVTTVMVCEM